MLEVASRIKDQQYEYASFRGTFSMVDRLGNATESTVVQATFDRDTIDRINFQHFLPDNVYEIATTTGVHPDFRK